MDDLPSLEGVGDGSRIQYLFNGRQQFAVMIDLANGLEDKFAAT
jgi:hypothetical protein